MKQFLLTGLTALTLLATSFTSSADDSTLVNNYTEDFTTLYKGASSSMTRTGYPYPAHYWLREGVTNKSMTVNSTYDASDNSTKRSIGWSVANQGSASTSSEALVTPKVGGDISFYIHRSISSTTSTLQSEVELFNMTVNESGTWTRSPLENVSGISITGTENLTTELPGNDLTKWKKIEITGVPDGTRIGIRLNGLLIDDFSASKMWKEWPEYLWDGTIIPYIDITNLGTASYTKYYLDENNNFLDGDKPYELTVQLKQTVNAGAPTDDMFKYMFKLKFANISGADQYLTLVDESNQPIILQFENKLENDWLSTSSATNFHDEKTIKFGLKNLDSKYFNQNASLVAIKLDQDNNQVGSEISMQRKNTVANDGSWNATSWSNFQFEALIPQPTIAYSLSTVTDATTATSLKGNTLSDIHPWFINPIGNEAPIYIGNTAGRATAKITNVEFDNDNFGLAEQLSFPISVGSEKNVGVKPSIKATQPGFYTGKMKVYVEGSSEPFEALLEGAVKPDYATKYLFHNEQTGGTTTLPSGWLTTGTWAISNMSNGQHKVDNKWTYSMNSGSVTAGNEYILVSPKINFNDNAEIWYDATCYQTTGKLELLYSTDRSNWQVLKTMTVNLNPTDDNPYSEDNFNSFLNSKGSYTENLWKTFKASVPVGEGYIAFRTGSNNARVDNIVIDGTPVTMTFDVAYISNSVPGKFSLNKVKDFSVTFRNLLDEIAAEEYVLEIVQDGQVLQTIEGTQALTTGKDITFPLQTAFSTDGEHTLSVNLIKGEDSVSSETVTVNVVDEGYDETFQVGASHSANRLCEDYNSWPITPNISYAVTSEAIYPKSWLQDLNTNGSSEANNGLNFDPNGTMTGLKQGDKITSISWIGYAGATVPGKTEVGIPVEVYIENTTDESFANNSQAFKDGSDMTCVFSGTAYYDLTKTNSGTYTNATTPLVDTEEGFFKIVFDQPFEYEGNNIRIQLRLPQVVVKEESATDEKPFFDWTNNGSSIAGSLWALEARGTASNDNTYRLLYQSGSGSNKAVNALLPMLIMGKEVPAKKLTGTVKNATTQAGIEGVTVTASSPEGVSFSGVTESDGSYSIEVGNPAFDFTITASHDKYHPYTSTETVNLADGDQEHHITLVEKTLTISGVVKDGQGATVEGATVTLNPTATDAQAITATTGTDGEFSLTTNQLNSTLSITVTKTGYVPTTEENIDVEEADVTLDDIVIYKLATISGTVKDEEDFAVEGAVVTLSKGDDDDDPQTTTTSSTGQFTFEGNDLDTDYTLTVEADGYPTYTETVSVEKEDITLNIKLSPDESTYLTALTNDGVTVIPGFGRIEIQAAGVDVVVVSLDGRVIATYQNLDGSAIVDGLSAGVYVVNNTKVVVR